MQLVLIRHARPERTEDTAGPADPQLTDVGRAQAAAMAAWLAAEPIDAIHVSPLRRARETAAPLEELTGLSARIDEGLTEFDRGNNYYIPMDELKAENHPDWKLLTEGKWDALDFDPFAFRDGVVTTIDAIAATHPSSTVAVVCHGGVINAYVSALLGLGDPLFFEPEFSGMSRVLVSRQGIRSIRTLNESAHLRDLA